MSESYRVDFEKPQLVFSAAHFITFNSNVCERLHGHNYRVRAHVAGELDENHYVIDFIALRDELQLIVDELDHRVLLPASHPQIKVVVEGKETIATFQERRWVFPVGDCVILPVPNTTAELIARYIGLRLLDRLEKRLGSRPQEISLGVDENGGQWGVWNAKP